jgi:murein DD-endopeptidase MepM/ murein hydrolase activator NlpD
MPSHSFANPVAGRIRPPGSPKIDGSFRVTAAFGQIDAAHPTPHIGVDMGNLRCGEPILAVAAGEVSFIQRNGGNVKIAQIVRIQHDGPDDVESGYAHLATIPSGIALRKRVEVGHVLGTLGRTGAEQCHLHFGVKLDGEEVDGWPLLAQNQEIDMLKGTNAVRLFNKKGRLLGDNTRFRAGPSIREGVLDIYAKDTEIAPDFIVDGGSVGGAVQWYATWGNTPAGKQFGYIHVSTVGPLVPIEVVAAPIA